MSYSPFRFLPSILRKKKPVHLTFFVTRRCNAACPFCFYAGAGGGSTEKELQLDEIARFSESLSNLLWLAFSGGEIFLRDDLPEITKIFYKNNRPSIILLPTNGIATQRISEMTARILRDCPESTVVAKLSIDGIGGGHDKLRGVNGSFNRVIETYEALSPQLTKHRNFELGVNTVFCSANEDNMTEIMDFVRGLKAIKTHTLSLIRGDTKEATLKDVDLQKYLDAAERLGRDIKTGRTPVYGFRGAKIKAAQDILQRRLIHKTVSENRGQLACYAGRLNIVLTETGDLYPCESFKEDFRMGNIREHNCDVGSLMDGRRAKEVIDGLKHCYCSHECYMMTNILFNPRMYPALLKEYFALLHARAVSTD